MWVYLLYLIVPAVALLAGYKVFIAVSLRRREKKAHEFEMGAIRFTDREGRDMKIIRNADGSFRVVEEKKTPAEASVPGSNE
jgi:hypothetical protein